ncbi:uncharacterized protein EI90DRAFT_3144184 [Cantharellus anzutake]|uniref:uncharacterized protein n=1 Tax=Cantharellus anzutake TaxID=1750568 RepID=UPI001904D372|nr:uncharacterized protein EI90DRAFT_3144184 [Cantharellus anzutake]KAF8338867.1 hypothetical protein EI90DRAFT_3144184 [Cantharellus anzutake]
MLSTFDTILIIDDSTSDPLNPHSEDRWNMAKEALSGLFEIASRYDTDGVDIHFLNSKKVGKNVRGAREVHRLFDTVKPRGITPIGQKLEKLLLSYLAQIERAHDEDRRLLSEGKEGHNLEAIKPVNFIVLTDGAATDDPESVIVSAARRLDARNFPLSQVGIQFVQIGSDRSATRFLQELDDELTTTHHIRDMVDTTPYSPKNGQLSTRDIIKILVGGINRRIDKKGVPQ